MSADRKPRILIVTPEITYLPQGMGNMAGKLHAKAGGLADVSASLVAALFEPIIYHPMIVFFSLRGYYNYLTNKTASWGVMVRKGTKKKTS